MNGIIVGNHPYVDGQALEDLFRDSEEAMVIFLHAVDSVSNERAIILSKPKRTHPVSPVARRQRGR